eukprot:2644409-Prymnesium_polylepis.1
MPRKTDEDEHSLEMHLPYIRQVMQGQNFLLVPVLVGALSEANEAKYGKLFAEVNRQGREKDMERERRREGDERPAGRCW